MERPRLTRIPLGDVLRYKKHKDTKERHAEITRIGIENILATTIFEFPPDFPQRAQEAALKGPFVAAQNHQRNSDILAGAKAVNYTTEEVNKNVPEDKQIKGWVEYYAASLEQGTQGEMSDEYQEAKPILEKLGIEIVQTTTGSDIRKGRGTIEEAKEKGTDPKTAFRRVTTAVNDEQKSIIFAPEATVEGGSINPETGQIYGMRPFVEGSMYINLMMAARKTGFASFLPISVSGGVNVLRSRDNKYSIRAQIVGSGLRSLALMTVRVGNPITLSREQIKQMGPEGIDIFCGTEIAKRLKPHERGFYGKFVDKNSRGFTSLRRFWIRRDPPGLNT